MIPLVGDDLFQRLGVRDVGLRVFHLLGRGNGGFDDRRGVTGVGPLQGDRDDRAGLHVDGMLGFVREMRPAVFHLRHLRVGIVRIHPILVGGLLLPLPIQPCQIVARRRRDPRRLRESRQERVVALPGVAPHDAPHRRVRLERRRVNRHRLSLEQSRLHEALLHPREDRPVGVQIDQAPRPRDRRMVRRGLLQGHAQKRAERQRIRGAPGDTPFRVEAFEVADEQQAEVTSGRQAGPTHHRRVEARAPLLDEAIEVVRIKQGIQTRVERMAGRLRQIRCRDPQGGLLGLARAHRHTRQCSTTDRSCRSQTSATLTLTTGC